MYPIWQLLVLGLFLTATALGWTAFIVFLLRQRPSSFAVKRLATPRWSLVFVLGLLACITGGSSAYGAATTYELIYLLYDVDRTWFNRSGHTLFAWLTLGINLAIVVIYGGLMLVLISTLRQRRRKSGNDQMN